jgi:type IV pilus assembly protein PilW
MTLSLIVLGVVATVFAGTSRNRGDLERSSRLAENASYALEVLTDDLRLGGYFGEMIFIGVAWQTPSPCAALLANQGWAYAPTFTAPVALAGYAGTEAAPSCIDDTGKRIPGTAAIVVRRVSTDTTPIASATGRPYLQVSSCNADLPSGNVTWVYSNKPADFTLRKIDCVSPADVRAAVVRTYFISACDDCGRDATPTLKRAELDGDHITITPLVEGVENLQVEYGFDIDGDGNSDEFRATLSGVAGAPDNDWSNVVAVRLYVLARSPDVETGYADSVRRVDLGPLGLVTVPSDGHKRVVQTTTVRLNNPAGLREAP